MDFVHTADIHLGFVQYGLIERFKDYARAFKQIVDYAISVDTECVLICGDMFHHRSINSPTYVQAYRLLSSLKEAGIPVVAIEGNHDLALERDRYSWLAALEAQGLITLLNPTQDAIIAHTQVGDTSIFGTRWLGSSTAHHIPRIAEEIAARERAEHTVLMMHCALEGTSIRSGVVPMGSLMQLKEHVDYLALGHYHIPFERDGWIYNPGSPEMVSLGDLAGVRGFYHTTDGGTTFVPVSPRPVFEVCVDATGITTPEELYERIAEQTAAALKGQMPDRPIVVLTIGGTLGISSSALSTSRMVDAVQGVCDALTVRQRMRASRPQGVPMRGAHTLRMEEVERQVLMELASADGRYAGIEGLADALLEIKRYAATGERDRARALIEELLRRQGSADKRD